MDHLEAIGEKCHDIALPCRSRCLTEHDLHPVGVRSLAQLMIHRAASELHQRIGATLADAALGCCTFS